MQMPSVYSCDVDECAYNHEKQCHALAITVGDAQGPLCDTFMDKAKAGCEGGDPEHTANVGACHMGNCVHNERLECAAKDIAVGHKGSEIDCLTFST